MAGNHSRRDFLQWTLAGGAAAVAATRWDRTSRAATPARGAAPAVAGVGASVAKPAQTEPANDFVGTWQTTSGVISLVFMIKADGMGTLVLIQGGSHSIETFAWKAMPGGIFVEGLPRFRFWHGRRPDEARVEMEPLRPEWTNAEMLRFPQAFMMNRLETTPRIMKRNDAMPESWGAAELPADWDKTAGQRRAASPP